MKTVVARKEKITDVGRVYKGARKTNSVSSVTTKKKSTTVRLKKLWPEPDWAQVAMDNGNTNFTLVFFLIYQKLNLTPAFDKYDTDEIKANKTANYVAFVTNVKNVFENSSQKLNFETVELGFKVIAKGLEETYGWKYNRCILKKTYGCTLFYSAYDTELCNSLLDAGFGKHAQVRTDVWYSYCKATYQGSKRVYGVKCCDKYYKTDKGEYVVFPQNEQGLEDVKKAVQDLRQASYLAKHVFSAKAFTTRPTPLDGVNRIGAARFDGDDITQDQFMADFKFCGIEYGNWVTQSERQEFLNVTYDAMADLMELLGLPLHMASLNGKLGIAFGSRGKSNSSAFFEPQQNLIAITKTQAIGNMAHEFAHALDWYFGDMHGDKRFATKISYTNGYAYSAILEWMREWEEFYSDSNLYKTSKAVDVERGKTYFATAPELFARCFEQWVQLKLNENGANNNFLAWDAVDEPDVEYSVYPLNDEKLKNFELFNALPSIIQRMTQ